MVCTNCTLKNDFCKPSFTSLNQEINIYHHLLIDFLTSNDENEILKILDTFNINGFCYFEYANSLIEYLDNKSEMFKSCKNSDLKLKSTIEVLYHFFKNPDDGKLCTLLTEYRLKNIHNRVTFPSKHLQTLENFSTLTSLEKETLIKARIGQNEFKKQLLYVDCSCKICGLSEEKYLIASHIKPWAKSNNEEKVNIYNGFLLCPQHDKIFDLGYITFDEYGNIIISKKVKKEDYSNLNINKKIKIYLNEGNKPFVRWHRENVFVDSL